MKNSIKLMSFAAISAFFFCGNLSAETLNDKQFSNEESVHVVLSQDKLAGWPDACVPNPRPGGPKCKHH